MVSAAPTVSAARTAMPSIAAESNAGEDRSAHTGSAVTRPTASPTGSSTASTRGGQPAAAHASRHARRACSAGTSDTNGLDRVRHRYRMTSTSVPPSRPVAGSGTTR